MYAVGNAQRYAHLQDSIPSCWQKHVRHLPYLPSCLQTISTTNPVHCIMLRPPQHQQTRAGGTNQNERRHCEACGVQETLPIGWQRRLADAGFDVKSAWLSLGHGVGLGRNLREAGAKFTALSKGLLSKSKQTEETEHHFSSAQNERERARDRETARAREGGREGGSEGGRDTERDRCCYASRSIC